MRGLCPFLGRHNDGCAFPAQQPAQASSAEARPGVEGTLACASCSTKVMTCAWARMAPQASGATCCTMQGHCALAGMNMSTPSCG